MPPSTSQDLAQAEELFRDTGWWDEGFTVSILVESNNPTFEAVGLILKDSLERLNPKFRVNMLIVPEARFDEAHSTVPFQYAMWIKNADLFADPHQMMTTYFHPDGEWGETLGFSQRLRGSGSDRISHRRSRCVDGRASARRSTPSYLLSCMTIRCGSGPPTRRTSRSISALSTSSTTRYGSLLYGATWASKSRRPRG